jgi:hypothetical protein
MPQTWLGTGTRTGSGAHPPQWSPRLDDPPARAGGGGREGRGRGTRARLGYTHDMHVRCSRGAAGVQRGYKTCSGIQRGAAVIQDRCNGVQRGVPTQYSSVCRTERIMSAAYVTTKVAISHHCRQRAGSRTHHTGLARAEAPPRAGPPTATPHARRRSTPSAGPGPGPELQRSHQNARTDKQWAHRTTMSASCQQG